MRMTDFLEILPAASLAIWAVILLLVDLWIPAHRKHHTALLAAVGLAISFGFSLMERHGPVTAFNGMVTVDQLSIFFNRFFSLSGLFTLALGYDYLRRMKMEHSEFYPLLLISISGMMLITTASHLLVVFLALEMFSLPLYVLSGFDIKKSTSAEASLKYFLLGAFASGFFLFGIALIFGATGSMQFGEITQAILGGQAHPAYLMLGVALLLIGMAFKVAVVPFHMWVPDVYQGAPTPVVAFMAVSTKAAGFGVLVRFFATVVPVDGLQLAHLFWGLSALSMIVGNVLALLQKNIKRMLAYSSIAHAGYMFMVLAVFGQANLLLDGIQAILIYLVVYGIASFGTWAVVIQLEKPADQGLLLEDYAGLSKTAPLMAFSMLIFMLSFTGLPFTIGLVGKLFLFRTVVAGGFPLLAVIGLLASLASAFYYLRLVMIMFMQPGEPKPAAALWPRLVIFVSMICVVLLSFLPTLLIQSTGF